MDDQLTYGLGFSTSNIYTRKLISGAVYNSYSLNVYVHVYDMNGAYAVYEINQTITVIPDFVDFKEITQGIISSSPDSNLNTLLMQGVYLNIIQVLQGISSLLNEQSMSDKLGLLLYHNSSHSNKFPQIYGPLSSFTGVLAVI